MQRQRKQEAVVLLVTTFSLFDEVKKRVQLALIGCYLENAETQSEIQSNGCNANSAATIRVTATTTEWNPMTKVTE